MNLASNEWREATTTHGFKQKGSALQEGKGNSPFVNGIVPNKISQVFDSMFVAPTINDQEETHE